MQKWNNYINEPKTGLKVLSNTEQTFKLPRNQEEISYRRDMIASKNLYPLDRLNEIIKNRDSVNAEKDFDSTEYGFDDMYIFKVLAARAYIASIEEKDDNLVRYSGRVFLNENGVEEYPDLKRLKRACFSSGKDSETKEDLEFLKKKMHAYGLDILKFAKQEIIERLYVLELLALVSLDTLLPKLVRVCPFYFSCPSVIFFIMHHQERCKLETDEERKVSGKILKQLIIPDRRSIGKRKLPHWELYRMYKKLLKYIQPFYKAVKQGDSSEIKKEKSCCQNYLFFQKNL